MLTRSDDLEILLHVIDAGGFSAAANSLDIQVARVSRAVSKIEKDLGITILNRTTRRIELTNEGKLFVENIRKGLECLQQAEEDIISCGTSPQGPLRVDAVSPFILHQLVPLIKPFTESYPGISLELTSNEGIVDLIERKTDVAIRIGRLNDSTLHARFLGTSALHIVASPEYLSKRGVPKSITEILNHDLIGFSGAKILNNWPFKGLDTIKPNIIASNGETVRQLVVNGNGIACLSGFMINKDMAEGRLISLFDSEHEPCADRESIHAVYYKSSSVAKRISAFIDFVKPQFKF